MSKKISAPYPSKAKFNALKFFKIELNPIYIRIKNGKTVKLTILSMLRKGKIINKNKNKIVKNNKLKFKWTLILYKNMAFLILLVALVS
jgi:hypothetical protein